MRDIITLTTDFGYSDPNVGIMKGVIFSIRPDVRIIDITHQIPPQDIMRAALCVSSFHEFFPQGAIHVVVVDPGVGSNREAVIVQTKRHFYVGPNNGVFSLLDSEPVKAVKIDNMDYCLPTVSATFHGRDIFAPVAAHLTHTSIDEFGPEERDLVTIDIPRPVMEANGNIAGEIIGFDHFGNATTNITAEIIRKAEAVTEHKKVEVHLGEHRISSLSYYYQSAHDGKPGAIINSFNFLEIFIPNGNVEKEFNILKGNAVRIVFGQTD